MFLVLIDFKKCLFLVRKAMADHFGLLRAEAREPKRHGRGSYNNIRKEDERRWRQRQRCKDGEPYYQKAENNPLFVSI